MNKQIMPFEKFEYIINQIKKYEEKRDRISDFLEKEMCGNHYCLFNVGEDLQSTIIHMLADEFDCWYEIWINPEVNDLREELGLKRDERRDGIQWWDSSVRLWENDIEYWLYEDSKKIEIDGKEVPINTLREFYDYLVTYCVDKKKDK